MTTQTLCGIVRSYLQRSTSEDLDYLYSLGGDQFLEKVIKSNVNSGLSEDDDGLQKRSKQLGSNQLRKSGPITLFLQQISYCSRDLTIRAIIILSTIAIIVDFQTEGISRCTQELLMLTFCLISILVGAGLGYYIQINNQEDDNAPAYGEINVKVIRNGEVSEILDSQLLVGDLVVMQVGLPLSFDGILVSEELSVDESQLTGEANPAIKRPLAECLKARDKLKAEKEKHYIITVKQKKHPLPSPILLSGTKILEGEGKIIVLAVGARAQINQISILKEKLSPLQEKVMRVAEKFGGICLIGSFAITITLIVRFCFMKGLHNWEGKDIVILVDYLVFGLTLIVTTISEGLPLIVTLVLAHTVKRLMRDNVLVRKLETMEMIGQVDTICTDKTGCLTQNKMTLRSIWNEKSQEINVYTQNEISKYLTPSIQQYFVQCAVVNNSASLYTGSATDIAILRFFGENYEELRREFKIHSTMPFSSQRKRISTIIELNDSRRLVSRGASEIILECCSKFHQMSSDKVVPIDEDLRKQISDTIEGLSQHMRTICLAYKDISLDADIDIKDERNIFEIEKNDLTLFAILGFQDILRYEVPRAVKMCQEAGIKVRMITGDNKITSQNIAQECGILNQQSIVIEGPEFMNLMQGIDQQTTVEVIEDLNYQLEHIDVLARSRPEDKLTLVKALKKSGKIVAVSGDGTNDAPAMKEANVGISMGISGTEIAREASSLILLDDNFNSIVKAIFWGRSVYDNILKYICLQLSTDLTIIIISGIGALFSGQIFKAVQLLWINLIIDILASIVISIQSPSMQRKPQSSQSLISKEMKMSLVVSTTIMVTVMFMMLSFEDAENKFNHIFNVFIWLIIFNIFSECHHSNLTQKLILLGLITIQALMINICPSILGMDSQLTLMQQLTSILLGSTILIKEILLKLMQTRGKQKLD